MAVFKDESVSCLRLGKADPGVDNGEHKSAASFFDTLAISSVTLCPAKISKFALCRSCRHCQQKKLRHCSQ